MQEFTEQIKYRVPRELHSLISKKVVTVKDFHNVSNTDSIRKSRKYFAITFIYNLSKNEVFH